MTPRARSYPKFCEVSPPKMRGVTPKNARRHPQKCEASPPKMRGVTPKNARRHPQKCEASPPKMRGVTPKMRGVTPKMPKFYKVHFRASILARLSYQKSLKKLDWRVISKKNLLVRLTGASMRAICCVMSSTFHLKALITDK